MREISGERFERQRLGAHLPQALEVTRTEIPPANMLAVCPYQVTSGNKNKEMIPWNEKKLTCALQRLFSR